MPLRKTTAARASAWILTAALSMIWTACRPFPTTPTDTPDSTPSSAPSPEPIQSLTPAAEITTQTIWLPPAFRADSTSPAGVVLSRRLDVYETLHPGLRIEVRIKADSGTGGLRDSLASAAAAAPGALPDVIALDQSNLRAAAIKGLVYPLDNLLPAGTWEDCFSYARSISILDSLHYGLPFAGDAIVTAGTQILYPEPQRWSQAAWWTSPMFAPLGDSRALFLFFGYFAAGGAPMSSLAEAEIDPEPLARELEWLRDLQQRGALPPASLQIDSLEDSFLAIANIGESAVTLYSIGTRSGDFFIGYLPTPEGRAFSLATGWAWASAAPDLRRRTAAADLMIWLADPQFVAEWTAALDMLPPSQTALQAWEEGTLRSLAAQLSESALAFPNDEISAFTGPIFSKAARRVLVDGIPPADAAQEAARAIHP